MLKAILEILAAIFKFRLDPKQVAKREKEALDKKIADAQKAVYEGNEDKVNEIINRTAKVALLAVGLTLAGCVSRVTYVDDSAKVIRYELNGKPGWWVPDHVMADMLSKLERTSQ